MDRIYRIIWDGIPRDTVVRDGGVYALAGDLFAGYRLGPRLADTDASGAPGAGTDVLAPIVPGKIVAIGLNYKDHAAEQGKPLPKVPMFFLKPSTSVIPPGAAIRLPRDVGRIDYEAEMAIVIRRRATAVRAAEAGSYILGVTCCNDVTARDLQNQGFQYSHVKGYDTFAPLGPCIAVGLDPDNLAVEGRVNGTVRQASRTNQLVFSAADLVEYVSAVMTLEPGDVISTGTPSGIGPLTDGDVVSVTVEGVGTLTNPVQWRS